MKKSHQTQSIQPSQSPSQIDKIAKRIKDIRNEKGWSQTQFAEMMEMERSNYHRLENRGENLTIAQLQKIADMLGVSAASILSDETVHFPPDVAENKQLHRRVMELEDRIIDKQLINMGYESGYKSLQFDLNRIIFEVACTLGFAQWPTDRATKNSLVVTDARTREDHNGERVLAFGHNYAQLTADQLEQIFDYIKGNNHLLFRLFVSIGTDLAIEPNSIVQRTLQRGVYKLFSEDELNIIRDRKDKTGFDVDEILNNP